MQNVRTSGREATAVKRFLRETVGQQAAKVDVMELGLPPDHATKGAACMAFYLSGKIEVLKQGLSRSPQDTCFQLVVSLTESSSESEVVQLVHSPEDKAPWIFEYTMSTIIGRKDDFERSIAQGYVYAGVRNQDIERFIKERVEYRRVIAGERLGGFLSDCVMQAEAFGTDAIREMVEQAVSKMGHNEIAKLEVKLAKACAALRKRCKELSPP